MEMRDVLAELGISVPDVACAMEHIRKQNNVNIMKEAGDKDELGVVASFLG